MTLDEWIKAGGNNLSNYTEAWCKQEARINGKQLREMELEDICRIPRAGEAARREIARFRRTHGRS